MSNFPNQTFSDVTGIETRTYDSFLAQILLYGSGLTIELTNTLNTSCLTAGLGTGFESGQETNFTDSNGLGSCFEFPVPSKVVTNLMSLKGGCVTQRKYFASHSASPGSNPGSAEIFSRDNSLYCLVSEQY